MAHHAVRHVQAAVRVGLVGPGVGRQEVNRESEGGAALEEAAAADLCDDGGGDCPRERVRCVELEVSQHGFTLPWRRGGPRRRCAGSSRSGRCCPARSEEHTSELQSLMRNSYAVFCLKKKN